MKFFGITIGAEGSGAATTEQERSLTLKEVERGVVLSKTNAYSDNKGRSGDFTRIKGMSAAEIEKMFPNLPESAVLLFPKDASGMNVPGLSRIRDASGVISYVETKTVKLNEEPDPIAGVYYVVG